MTREEYFRKNYPDSCYGDKPLSPYWDLFQAGVEFGERQSEKQIAELEKENAELKEKLGDAQMQKAGKKSDLVWKLKTANEQKAEQLTNAKEIIKE